MKAYYAHDKDGDCSTIVFAENATRAKLAALASECFEDTPYINIRVRRMPEADKLYKGSSEIDWYDEETRATLVRDFGWACFEPSWECDNCSVKQCCHWHAEEGMADDP